MTLNIPTLSHYTLILVAIRDPKYASLLTCSISPLFMLIGCISSYKISYATKMILVLHHPGNIHTEIQRICHARVSSNCNCFHLFPGLRHFWYCSIRMNATRILVLYHQRHVYFHCTNSSYFPGPNPSHCPQPVLIVTCVIVM